MASTPAPYSTLPHDPSGITVSDFKVHYPDDELKQFKELLKLSRLAPKTWESLQDDRRFGVTHEWIEKVKEEWEGDYDWRKTEDHINSFPNYTADVKDDDGHEFKIHFVALFSKKKDAIPITLTHGWPGSFLEFLDMFEHFKKKYSEDDLPYHLIATSLVGYTFSSTPPLDRDWTNIDSARIINKVMVGLGFGNGYIAQGGDVGSYVSRMLAVEYDGCKAMHLNFNNMYEPSSKPEIDDWDRKLIEKAQTFIKTGAAYAQEHGTRPGTIGFTLASSPLALLAWIGEKFLEWTDKDPPLSKILDSVTLYWLTETFPRAIYPYRQAFSKGPDRYMQHQDPQYYCKKPMGYSSFPLEIYPSPRAWVETTGNLVWFKRQERGGHFAAMECPEELSDDVEDFVKTVWKKSDR